MTSPAVQDSTPSTQPDDVPTSSLAFNSKAGRGTEAGGQYCASLLLGKEKAFVLFQVIVLTLGQKSESHWANLCRQPPILKRNESQTKHTQLYF